MGAIIGGTASAAKNIKLVKVKKIERQEAVKDTVKEAAWAGLATAVVGAVGTTGLLSLFGILAIATGTKYLWDTATVPEKTKTEKAVQTEPPLFGNTPVTYRADISSFDSFYKDITPGTDNKYVLL
ncbi:MAG: magnetosome protein MamC [Deltaproteobacteria bacterium]|nr:magnetosome protein MamC [Deltaproteobacteria bacterium]